MKTMYLAYCRTPFASLPAESRLKTAISAQYVCLPGKSRRRLEGVCVLRWYRRYLRFSVLR